MGPRDQRVSGRRDDVLVYQTPVLEEDVEVTGPVEVTVYASSSATDTDFTAKLIDVSPSGFAMNLTDGL
jgi:predicted acyl esterase